MRQFLANFAVKGSTAKHAEARKVRQALRQRPLIIACVDSTPVRRILGLDVGSRRIGIAVTDPLGITAQGLETLQRRNKRYDFDQLGQVIRQYKVKEIVVGLPLRMSGAEGTQSEKMRIFAEELRKKFGLPVHLWDERLTSAEANRFLRETDLSIEKRGRAVDRMAAVLILQGWMERRGVAADCHPEQSEGPL